MKVLWFTDTASLYKKSLTTYNGSGWIESLERIITSIDEIELGISFFHNDECFKSKQGNTTYYPLPLYNTILKRLHHTLFYNKCDNKEVEFFMKVVNDFQPDIIHIFGSEKSYGLITYYTKIPVVIHIQGILNPCINAYFAPGNNKFDLIKQYLFNPIKLFNSLKILKFFSYNAKRELEILKNCKYFIGRTEWDKKVNLLYAPDAKYFYCSEALRNEFYEDFTWTKQQRNKINIVTTISKVPYKGFDLILKTANILKKSTNFDFTWDVFGINEYKFWEKKLGINCKSVNVFMKGITDSLTLAKKIKDADIYVHPSYIDNSPNSVCEAQILGTPVIATFVGGIPTLIENNKTGILVPTNDPIYLAAKIIELSKNENNICLNLSQNARLTALKRHNRDGIISDLLAIYKSII